MNWSSSVGTFAAPLWFIERCFTRLFLISLSISGSEICFLFRWAASLSPFAFFISHRHVTNSKLFEVKISPWIENVNVIALPDLLGSCKLFHTLDSYSSKVQNNISAGQKNKTNSLCGVIQELWGSNGTGKQQRCRSVFSRDINRRRPGRSIANIKQSFLSL